MHSLLLATFTGPVDLKLRKTDKTLRLLILSRKRKKDIKREDKLLIRKKEREKEQAGKIKTLDGILMWLLCTVKL